MSISRVNKFVFILGMHRSGTSCLTGSLERCGLFLGNVSRFNRYNAKGNHEIKEVYRLHKKILALNGGNWRQPPSIVVVEPQYKRDIRKIISQLARYPLCGLKDPRLLLLLDIWVEMIDSYMLVGTFRHPSAVAKSLAKRDQMSKKMHTTFG